MSTRILTATFDGGRVERLYSDTAYTHAYRVTTMHGAATGWARSFGAANDAANLNVDLMRRNGYRDVDVQIVESAVLPERAAA